MIAALALAACDRFAPAATPTPTAPLPGTPTTTATLPPATARPFTATLPATRAPQPSETGTPTETPLPAPTADPCLARHTVQPGERLFRIGLQYGVDWQEIARANNIGDPALIYPGQVLCIPAGSGSPGPTPPPPPTAAWTQPATGTPGTGAGVPVILGFSADKTNALPGDTITLSWNSTEADTATLVEPICCASNGGNVTRQVPPTGSVTITLSAAVERDTLVYNLYAFNSQSGGSAGPGALTVFLPCPDTYFFGAQRDGLECPAGPAVHTPAAEQIFEGGRMIWLEALDTIFVLFGDGQPPAGPANPPDGYAPFPDTWTPGEPESDPALTPPADRVQPVRGFGKVWRGELVPGQTVRDALGWALGPEQTFAGIYQRTWKSCLAVGVDTPLRNCSGPGGLHYLESADGRLIRLAEFGVLARHSIAQWQFGAFGE